MKILVTGGAGFIGSAFCHYMKNKYGKEVELVVLDALTYAGSIENLPVHYSQINEVEGFSFWYGNITNSQLVNELVSQVDVVVGFAAETHVSRSIYDNQLFTVTDVLGTQCIANAVCKHKKSIKRFIHVSTSEVYGTAEAESMSEDHPLNPASPYAAAKAGADRLVYSYWRTYGIPATIIRPFNNYGPRQHLEKLIPRFITNMIMDEPLRIHGDGSASRDFVHADDTCRAIDLLLNIDSDSIDGKVYNVGSGVSRSILDIAKDISSLFGKEAKLEKVGDRPGQVVRHTAECHKIASLGWIPRVDWMDGLSQTIEWYKNNRDRWEKQIWMRSVPIVTASGKKEWH
ncbi:MAG: GDP-mannose 4,6-dehydratase [Candidatus Paceibacterota bacterium]